MQKDKKSNVSPRMGTFLVGIANSLSSLISIFLLKRNGRRFLLVGGHFLIGICHFLVGILNYFEYFNITIYVIFIFYIIYMNSSGPIALNYAAETLNDSALGIILFSLW
jgi:hypothetical protein